MKLPGSPLFIIIVVAPLSAYFIYSNARELLHSYGKRQLELNTIIESGSVNLSRLTVFTLVAALFSTGTLIVFFAAGLMQKWVIYTLTATYLCMYLVEMMVLQKQMLYNKVFFIVEKLIASLSISAFIWGLIKTNFLIKPM